MTNGDSHQLTKIDKNFEIWTRYWLLRRSLLLSAIIGTSNNKRHELMLAPCDGQKASLPDLFSTFVPYHLLKGFSTNLAKATSRGGQASKGEVHQVFDWQSLARLHRLWLLRCLALVSGFTLIAKRKSTCMLQLRCLSLVLLSSYHQSKSPPKRVSLLHPLCAFRLSCLFLPG